MYLSVRGRKFKKDVAALLKEKLLHDEGIANRIKVRIELCPPNKRKIDIDNRIKPILDSLQHGGLFLDDEQIDEIVVIRGELDQHKKGFCHVLVTECV